MHRTLRPLVAALPVVVAIPGSCPSRQTDTPRPAHHTEKGGYTNPWPSFVGPRYPNPFLIWKDWVSRPIPPPELLPQVVPVDWGIDSTATEEERLKWSGTLRSTWLGHACFLVEFPAAAAQVGSQGTGTERASRGARVLFDPIFSNRCSPSQYVGPARVTKPPFPVEDLPHVDAVILSHNHYDHTDINTLQHIYHASPKGSVHFFTPLGTKQWFLSNGFDEQHVSELDWWHERDLQLQVDDQSEKQSLRISCTPCQHFSGRGITDRCDTLWASWAVEQLATTTLVKAGVWFGGDTGYKSVARFAKTEEGLPVCPAFKEIGKKFGGFDLSMIPIGAYDPRWAFASVHCNPEDAVELHLDVKSKRSIGGHWGTWVLTCEDMTEPPKRLRAAMKAKGLPEAEFGVCDIGETVVVEV